MPIEKQPRKLIPKDYHPPSSVIYKVKDNESFVTIAEKYHMEEWELIYENFRTRDPAEINWYLRNYVGCNKKTLDGNNYIFSTDATPGLIHIPDQIIHIPRLVEPSMLRNVWAGIAKSHSGDLAVIGAHDLTGKIYNLGDELPDVRNAVININGWKFGVGLGGSIGAVFVIAHGYENQVQMNGVTEAWDFDFSVVGKLDSFLKGLKGIGKTIDTIQKYKKTRWLAENVIKNRGITSNHLREYSLGSTDKRETIKIVFKKISLNPELLDDKIKYKPPRGMEVIDITESLRRSIEADD